MSSDSGSSSQISPLTNAQKIRLRKKKQEVEAKKRDANKHNSPSNQFVKIYKKSNEYILLNLSAIKSIKHDPSTKAIVFEDDSGNKTAKYFKDKDLSLDKYNQLMAFIYKNEDRVFNLS